MLPEITDFQGLRVTLESLVPFGFKHEGDAFTYAEAFMDGDFEARISISTTGEVTSQVWDLAMDEPYLALQIARVQGPFVGQVREAFQAVLAKVAQHCFEELPFVHDQTNRLAVRLSEEFGDQFDHPFQRDSSYRSFRVSGKWYALIFPLKRGKLGPCPEKVADEVVEVLNLKVASDQIEQILAIKGIYPSYHMSKKNWVSIILDESLSDEVVWDLLVASRRLVDPRAGKTGATYWVQPANLKYYDIDAEFANHSLVTWEQKGKIAMGDWVAIYITAPTQAIRYLCQVTEANEQQVWLKLHKVYDDEAFPLTLLQTYGLKSVRSLRRLPEPAIDALKASLEQGHEKD